MVAVLSSYGNVLDTGEMKTDIAKRPVDRALVKGAFRGPVRSYSERGGLSGRMLRMSKVRTIRTSIASVEGHLDVANFVALRRKEARVTR